MATTTPVQAVPIPDMADPDNVPGDFARTVGYMETRLVMRFADANERDLKIPVGARVPGMVAITLDNGIEWTYRTIGAWSGWTPAPGTCVFDVRQTVAQSVVNGGTGATAVLWDTEIIDLLNAKPASSSYYFTPPVPGHYLLNGSVAWATNAAGQRLVLWYKAGAAVVGSGASIQTTAAQSPVVVAAPTVVSLTGAEAVTLAVNQNSGAALLTYVTPPWQSAMNAIYLGP